MQGKYLITTDGWFFAPDGKLYRAVWGNAEVMQDDILGVKTNRNSTNWFLKIGSEANHIIVAGCQIHYAVRCEARPNDGPREDWVHHEGKPVVSMAPSSIYIAE